MKETVMNEQTTVLLYELGSLALIVPASTGIVSGTKQEGTHAFHPKPRDTWFRLLAMCITNVNDYYRTFRVQSGEVGVPSVSMRRLLM